ncbi:insulin-related peptide binding protein [Danaus plexippus plexippus]|uniref:Insulin-related peptide binding protein n=2 Tax=Danaus plexippus TaxID=13037 RepID=A0A212F6N7_DANPL|nr:insulin-related peptide binding protein [Danaus plexippus plexippus]
MICLVSLLVATALTSQCFVETNALVNPKIEMDNNLLPDDVLPVHRTAQRNAYVKISTPPPESVNFIPGTALVLECEVQGHPLPIVGWLKNGVPLSDFEEEVNEILPMHPSGYGRMINRLVISDAENEDVYTCVGTAGLKEAVATTTVFVEANQPFLTSKMFSTKPIITGFYLDIFQNMGTSLTLPCRVYSPLKSQLYWIDNNDNIVYGNSRMRVLPSGDLHIKNLAWENMGGYTCTVKNAFGKDSMNAFLYPVKPSETEMGVQVKYIGVDQRQ